MRKYKTSEVIAMLEENPKLIFTNGYIELGVEKTKDGYEAYDPKTECGVTVTMITGKYANWELVQQPIPFMEAVKAYSEGKIVDCVLNNETCSFAITDGKACMNKLYGYAVGCDPFCTVSTGQILNGKWYVRISNE